MNTMIQLVATTEQQWHNYTVPSLKQFRYIVFCINDSNMSHYPPSIYPLSIFKTCNTVNRNVMLCDWNTVKCYACYIKDTQINIYIGGSGRQVTAYGIK